ncbi:type 2 lanthipeptide synthetase LanM family protein [Kitasatospora sp. NPDC001547]|uniref:type 2 lanthipeptide synthetase LanM family protein n=1 Tax=Kitasatospora sp. NPDC001547 TaxID=3364015 RepID=UPI0036BFB5D8
MIARDPTTVNAGSGSGGWWLPAVRAADRAPAGRPDWAVFVERAVAGAPTTDATDHGLPAGDLPGVSGFRPVVAPLARLAGAGLPTALPAGAVDLPAVRARFVDGLTGTLARQAARTLVLELNVAREEGVLAGDSPADRFRDFVRRMAAPAALRALFGEYPVLARVLARTCLAAADAFAELLTRFAADRREVTAALFHGVDPGPLVAVRRDAGDGHQGGRSVAVLRFAGGGRLVYRPRPTAVHRHLADVVHWFNTRPGTPGLRTPALLERPGYGWLEFVERRPCTEPAEVQRFYLRQGAWLALLHALDATDLHAGNLIACGEHPVPVDLETLFHPPAPADPDRPDDDPWHEDPAALALQASVHRTGLLPRLVLGDERALDASGLGGDAGAGSPSAAVRWAAAGTDGMRLVRGAAAFAGAENRPRLDGTDSDPADHLDELLAGFRAGRRALVAGLADLTGPRGLLSAFAEDEVRVVLRATEEYATLLDESTHPDVLREAGHREALFRTLGTGESARPGPAAVIDEEVAELWAGDVPLFTTRPGGTELRGGRGRPVAGALDRPGLDRVAERLTALGATGPAEQEWIVRAAMAARSTGPAHGHTGPGTPADPPAAPDPARLPAAPDPARLLAAAREIGDRLVDGAHRSADRANWLGLDLIADRYWRLAPAGADLGGGYPGPALFLAQLAALTGADRYAEVARLALRPVPALLERLAARPEDLALVGSGAWAGLGGLTWALAQVGGLLDDREVLGWVGPAVRLTAAAAEAEEPSGLADGTAGGLAALLAVGRETGDAEALAGARRCAERLLGRLDLYRVHDAHGPDGPRDRPDRPAPGFATGTAGLGWALLAYAQAGGGAAYRHAGLAALRSSVAGRAPGGSCCEGAPGIALAVIDSGASAGDPELAAWAGAAVDAAVTAGSRPDHSLCHGETGVLELLGRAPGAAARQGLARRSAALLDALARTGPVCGTPGGLAVPGLLFGLSGVGHGLLRLGFAHRTASALLLAPGSTRPFHEDAVTHPRSSPGTSRHRTASAPDAVIHEREG